MRSLCLLALLGGLVACSPEQETRARERFEVEKERARAGLEAAVERLDQEARELQSKLAEQRGEAAEQWRKALEDVEARKVKAREKLDSLAAVGADAWAELRQGFERAAEELQRADDPTRTPAPTEEPEQR